MATRRLLAFPLLLFAFTARPDALQVEILKSIGGLPPHIVGTYEEPVDFEQDASGLYFVFDRRGHTVHTVDPDRRGTRKAVEIGQEEGRVIQPTGFDVAPDGRFVVTDLPRAQQRIQTFTSDGTRIAGFFLPGQPAGDQTEQDPDKRQVQRHVAIVDRGHEQHGEHET